MWISEIAMFERVDGSLNYVGPNDMFGVLSELLHYTHTCFTSNER